MSDAVSRDELIRLCEQYEGSLRRAHDPFPKEWDEALSSLPVETALGALKRFGQLKHYSSVLYARTEERPAVEAERAQAAARKLLQREPIRVTLANGRTIRITSRSLAAMAQIAAHQSRIRLLDAELSHIADLFHVTTAALKHERWRRRSRLRRRARRLQELYRRLHQEIYRHRAMLYAHVSTASGAAAREGEPLPEWWDEVAPEDEAKILMALYAVGPMRYAELGPPPERKGPKSPEDWGYEGLLASWGIRKNVDPAEMFDRDLAQIMAEIRTSAPPPPGTEDA